MFEQNNNVYQVNSNGPVVDENGNEISKAGKFFAAFFLIFFTIFSAVYLIGHWPDKLVTPGSGIRPLYIYNWFHVELAGIRDSDYVDPAVVHTDKKVDNAVSASADTIAISPALKDLAKIDSIKKYNAAIKAKAKPKEIIPTTIKCYSPSEKLMHINTLLLILVAVGGFLGNMIYISTSFTTYIGNGKFRSSWTMWYFVKPFTASGLAIAIYFVFRGGFLNMSDDSTNINLYGLMTISIMAGLFTDRTTLKLKEVFDVLLRPKEERNDTLTQVVPEITTVKAPELEAGKPALITINGKNLDKSPLTIKIEGTIINDATKQPLVITFNYTLPVELKDKDFVKLEVFDEKGNAVGSPAQLLIKKAGATTGGNTPVDAELSTITVELKLSDDFMKTDEAKDITVENYKQAEVKLTAEDNTTITLTSLTTDASGKTFSASNIKFGNYVLAAEILGEHNDADTNSRTSIQLVASNNIGVKEPAANYTLVLEMS